MKTVDLCGAWQFREADKGEWLPAVVPGSVLADLMRAGKTPDPFWRENEYAARDLFDRAYEYQHSFRLEEGFLEEERVELCCDGLDTLAEVRLNGQIVLSANNMHRRWIVDVKSALHSGENQIHILFASPNRFIADRFARGEVTMVNAGCMPGSNYLRKAHCMFGWDWGPQLPDAGIWRPISLRGCSGAFLEEVYPVQRHEDGKVILTLKAQISHRRPGARQKLAARLETPSGDILAVEKLAAGDENELVLTVENPQLWWPNGFGGQPLYNLTVSLTEDDQERGVISMRLGLRTLTVSTQPDQWGREFAMVVNGVKIFSMGADYIPEDNIFSRITSKTTEKLIRDCVRANFNSIRVWGGGYYPDDWFYDLCDEYGLLVWQDFMYACNVYDFTEEFERNITAETIDNIKRLRHHASLAIWCGNNEMEEAWVSWDNVVCESPKLKADYLYQFEFVMKRLAREYDPETFYWPSSPSSGGSFHKPNDPSMGDVHYWEVWHGRKPFTDYRKYQFRYCSEFGFQSFPCLKTVESFTLPGDRNVFSPVMESHQKSGSANGTILFYLSDTYRYPKDFDSLLYVSQLLQAQAIQYGVEHWRRNRGVCMGAIYWQLNDCWPVASWASIDCFGRWKALHYAARKFFSPLTASILDEGSSMAVWVENELRAEAPWRLEVFLKDMQNRVLWQDSREGAALPLSAKEAIKADFAEKIQGRERELYFEYRLWQGEELQQNDVAFFVRPKQLELPETSVSWKVREEKDRFIIALESTAFACKAELAVQDADAVFSDNYISLTGGTREIFLQKSDLGAEMTGDQLDAALRVRSLRDTY